MLKRLFIFLLALFIVCGILFLWWKDAISPVNINDKTPISFVISKGQSIKEIANNLENKGLIKDKIAFFLYIRFTNLAKKIQAGNYRLSKAMNTIQIANELTHGTTDIWVTVIEGWRVEETALLLAQSLAIPESEFLKYAREGYMFPDTYLIPQNASASAVSEMMLKNFSKKVDSNLINKGREQGLNLEEIINLASIVEREARGKEDRAIVAGILLKRLKNGWPLQADATIQYALGYQPEEKTWWKKNLTKEDLKIDSLYNTYKYKGLPPTPICNPGLSAISAVVSPSETKYWYYLSDKKGNMHYAVTEEEHNENIDKYLQ